MANQDSDWMFGYPSSLPKIGGDLICSGYYTKGTKKILVIREMDNLSTKLLSSYQVTLFIQKVFSKCELKTPIMFIRSNSGIYYYDVIYNMLSGSTQIKPVQGSPGIKPVPGTYTDTRDTSNLDIQLELDKMNLILMMNSKNLNLP